MESLQFVVCSWFIGLIGLGFRFTGNKSTENRTMCASMPIPCLPCSRRGPQGPRSSTHLDAPGVHRLAHAETSDRHGVNC
jgi:hypothetical protein